MIGRRGAGGGRGADLHTHSFYSDGEWAPEALVAEAARLDLEALALADHNTVGGLARALAAGRAAGVRVVPAVELLAAVDGRLVELLGYGVPADEAWLDALFGLDAAARAEKERVWAARAADPLGTRFRFAIDRAAGRFLTLCVPAGEPTEAASPGAASAGAAAAGRGALAAFEQPIPAAADVIRAIHDAGGVAVWAHPCRAGDDGLLWKLVTAGLDGVEAYYWSHGPADTARYVELARRQGLLVTGGSDFHGAIRPESPLGGTLAPRGAVAALLRRLDAAAP